ncbi:MAG: hypothetical protein J7500_13200 [Sphingomonas sp.]|uniref:hypothetical protein n=1 Tax=Sphingomonas sp. TaxID=28214 RepID=UPI001B0F417F|nr:hypothetical protein [Sphingomonas sp.]MBO9623658.1 hypothetical protein [Sphingomonas sp.]
MLRDADPSPHAARRTGLHSGPPQIPLRRLDARQRAFIAALAETGSVTAAAARVNMAKEGAYQMRLAPGSESFRAAWAAALDHGVQRLADVALERAMEGVTVPVFHKGEQCGERRWYNDRLLMFLLKHHLPGKYGVSLPLGTRARATIEREAAENCPVCRQRAEAKAKAAADPVEQNQEVGAWLKKVLQLYWYKVEGERQHRLAGEVVAADFLLRQLTHLELILDSGGFARPLIERWTRKAGPYGTETVLASPLSKFIDELRSKVWEESGDPPRPALRLEEREFSDGLHGGGGDVLERDAARRSAARRIAEAQAEWEAAARPDTWEAWKAGRR